MFLTIEIMLYIVINLIQLQYKQKNKENVWYNLNVNHLQVVNIIR